MASFYLDNDCTYLAGTLRGLGHTAQTSPEQGMAAARDAAQLAHAARRGWIFVTHNRRHFVLLHEAWVTWGQPAHAGIIIPAQSRAWPPERISGEIQGLLHRGHPRPNECWRLRMDGTWVQH